MHAGNKLSVIENLGVTQDQFDSIDFTDNEIQKLENFPMLRRLKMLLLCNNKVSRIAPKLGESLPHLETLILTNNKIESLDELDNLADVPTLRMISLIGNPVTQKANYRLHLIAKLPNIKMIDFSKVKPKVIRWRGKKPTTTTCSEWPSLRPLSLIATHTHTHTQHPPLVMIRSNGHI